jgi:hypothetical protein
MHESLYMFTCSYFCVFMLLFTTARERHAKPDRIISLQSILLRQLRYDEKGLPLQLDEVVEKKNAQTLAIETAKRQLADSIRTGQVELKQMQAGATVEDSFNFRLAVETHALLLDTPLAEVTVHVVEAVRPHRFDMAGLLDANFLYVVVSVQHQLERAGALSSACLRRPKCCWI